jgi:tRNA G18 (ribose-2'-O)-methylase SpoU
VKLERIADAGDPRLVDYRGVRDPEWLRSRGVFLAEGRGVVRILLAARDFRARSVVVTEAALAAVGDALDALPDATPVYLVTHAVLLATSGVRFHQGCVAVGERIRAPSVEEVLGGAGRVALALEDVVNPDNVGGLFRNAFAFGAGGVLVTARCAPPLYRKAIRTSLGATLRIPFTTVERWPDDLAHARAAGFALVALTPDPAALPVGDLGASLPLPPRILLLVGNEGVGLSRDALATADLRVRIPMIGGADSINVATAAAIALERMFELGGIR